MKKNIVALFVYIFVLNVNAINVVKLPRTIIQPDGTKIECFITGDEFGGMIHDTDGYALIKNKNDGWWYYAIKDNNENPVCSKFIVGRVSPEDKGLQKGIYKFNKKFYDDVSKHRKENIGKFSVSGGILKSATLTTSGLTQVNSLVIFIRFNGQSEFYHNRDYYSTFFNSTTSQSLKDYFLEASYNQLNVNSTFYPVCASTTNQSYVDTYNRSYYISSEHETNGYNSDTERTDREHSLLKRAIEAIASQVPANLNIDTNNDGLVDDVCFIVQGGASNVFHNDLLWPHHWALFSYNVNINGKRVFDYTLLNYGIQFNAQTICHEFFHGLGAPDFYRSSNNDPTFEPTGYWGLMGDSHDNFLHMDAYSKNRYGGWIASIPEITQPGTYSLLPITSNSSNCYKIKSPFSCDEYFIVEYRKKSGKYENTLEGDGLLVYRINPNGDNYYGPHDEAYIYRPGGTLTINGNPASANYSSQVGRTSISDITSPSSFLKSGAGGGLKISNIGSSGTTISFNVDFPFSISGPSLVCTSDNTYYIPSPPPGNSIVWTSGPGLTITSGQNTTSCTFSSTGIGSSWVMVTLVNDCGNIPLTKKDVWRGAPVITGISGPTTTPNNMWASYSAVLASSSTPTEYNWILSPLNGNYVYNYGNSVTLSFYNSGYYRLQVQAKNACTGAGYGPIYETSIYVYDALGLAISPNPATDEATIRLVGENKDAPVAFTEWDYEIYDPMQSLKEKKTKLKTIETKINTAGWMDGVYIVRAKVGDKILSEKVVVKH